MGALLCLEAAQADVLIHESDAGAVICLAVFLLCLVYAWEHEQSIPLFLSLTPLGRQQFFSNYNRNVPGNQFLDLAWAADGRKLRRAVDRFFLFLI